MVSLLLWILAFPSILYHCFLTLTLLILLVCYKLFSSCKTDQYPPHVQYQHQLRDAKQQLSDKIRVLMMRTSTTPNRSGAMALPATRTSSLATIALVFLVLVPQQTTYALEQDAQILMPVANLTKSIIKTATMGVPLEVNFDPTNLVKNFAYFTWRTGFPVSMPRGFMKKAQDFYNRVRGRVEATVVKDVERKSLANLRLDLDEIVDSIVEEVRQSPDGLYTDYLQTRVNGIPLEDACTNVGVQLKAYGVDLTNYRNIAGVVLGLPVMPQVASAMVNVAGMAPRLDTFTNLTTNLVPSPIQQLPGAALSSVSQLSDTALRSLTRGGIGAGMGR